MGLVGGKRVAGLGDLGEWVSGGRLTAGGGEVAGRACPAPTDCRESLCTRGAREGGSPPPLQWAGVAREWMATQGPSESPSHLTVTAPFDKGASLAPCGGSGELPDLRWRKARRR